MEFRIFGCTIRIFTEEYFIIDEDKHCIPSKRMIKDVLEKIGKPEISYTCPKCYSDIGPHGLQIHWDNKIRMIKDFMVECERISGQRTGLKYSKVMIESCYPDIEKDRYKYGQ